MAVLDTFVRVTSDTYLDVFVMIRVTFAWLWTGLRVLTQGIAVESYVLLVPTYLFLLVEGPL